MRVCGTVGAEVKAERMEVVEMEVPCWKKEEHYLVSEEVVLSITRQVCS